MWDDHESSECRLVGAVGLCNAHRLSPPAAARRSCPDRGHPRPAIESLESIVRDEYRYVTEGTKAGVGINWERCHYDWSKPDSVRATVTESNVYAVPGSSWELRAVPTDGGSLVEMIWAREFARRPRGAIFGTLYRLVGKPIFGGYARKVLENIANLERPG